MSCTLYSLQVTLICDAVIFCATLAHKMWVGNISLLNQFWLIIFVNFVIKLTCCFLVYAVFKLWKMYFWIFHYLAFQHFAALRELVWLSASTARKYKQNSLFYLLIIKIRTCKDTQTCEQSLLALSLNFGLIESWNLWIELNIWQETFVVQKVLDIGFCRLLVTQLFEKLL